jgi:hypothetical protein
MAEGRREKLLMAPQSTKGTKGKRSGVALEMKLFRPKKARPYLVFRTSSGEFHVFQEVEAKDAARIYDPTSKGHTNTMWQKIWNKDKS